MPSRALVSSSKVNQLMDLCEIQSRANLSMNIGRTEGVVAHEMDAFAKNLGLGRIMPLRALTVGERLSCE